MQVSLLTDFIKCNVHSITAIILTIYKTNAAVLSAKRPQSIHKIPDVLHILPLKL